ncbi:hypothetical protein K2173_027177 [Erythroxylum novogranatense]|uniref:Large ribosomal subunit protein mL45 n=1 Tax=Erythroxylum novogranatense TaxID=1862640 RepID=A0AAV8TYG5_9ROSI|nr:hypothetical protein K2173_027177 [Erythroxylum novogranatense]
MAILVRRLEALGALKATIVDRNSSFLFDSSRSLLHTFSNGLELDSQEFSSCLCKEQHFFPWTHGRTMTLRSTMAVELSVYFNNKRLVTTHTRTPPQARIMGAAKVSISSPGFIYEPYSPRKRIPFWKRWFTKNGWKRTKEDIILEMKNAYAIAKLRKTGYSKHQFYQEAIELYKEINTLVANGDKTTIRKAVTEKMFSELKNQIKQRESMWHKIYWEMLEPVVKIRTLRARLIGVDRNDLSKVFIQLTLDFLTKQKFEAYDTKGSVVAGDKNKEVLGFRCNSSYIWKKIKIESHAELLEDVIPSSISL